MASVERVVRDGRTAGWQARWRDPAGAQRKQTFPRKALAERHLVDVEASKASGAYVDAARGRVLLSAFADEWMAGRAHLKPKTLAGYVSLLKTRLLPRWGTTPLAKITHSGVVAWVADMQAEGLSASRVRQAYHLLTSILDAAVRDSRLVRNPAAGVDLPRLRVVERRYLTHEQVATLGRACGPDELLVRVLAYTGLRWGEATALRVKRVEPQLGRLRVVEAVVDVNGHAVFGPPKTHQHRTVPVPAFLRADLGAALVGKGPDDLVFTAPRGGVLRVQNFRRRGFDAAATAVGLGGLVPHELRHTAASLAIAAGASVKGVQAMLGHASATLTLDRYGHLFADELDAVADRLDIAARAAGVPQMCPATPPPLVTVGEISL